MGHTYVIIKLLLVYKKAMTNKNGQNRTVSSEVKHTVASHFARCMLRNASSLGINEQTLLKAAQLSPSLLREPQSRISPQQLAMLHRAMWEEYDDELFGLTKTPMKVGIFQLIAERMIMCETLLDALVEAKRFYRLVSNSITFELTTVGDRVQLSIVLTDPEFDPEHMLVEFLLLVWHRFPSWLVGEVIPLQEVHFAYSAPEHKEEYSLLYPGPCHFNKPKNMLIWHADSLKWPVRRNAKQLKQYLKQVPLPWFSKQHYAESFTDRVVNMLVESPESTFLSLEDVAKKIHVTPRTVRRKLKEENSCFKQLKDNVRRDRAIYWLSLENMTVAEASRYSGYSEPSAFVRAFRQWTGITPGDYRKRLFNIR